MNTQIEQLLSQVNAAIDNNNMVGSKIYPTVESALLDIKEKIEMINNLENLKVTKTIHFKNGSKLEVPLGLVEIIRKKMSIPNSSKFQVFHNNDDVFILLINIDEIVYIG